MARLTTIIFLTAAASAAAGDPPIVSPAAGSNRVIVHRLSAAQQAVTFRHVQVQPVVFGSRQLRFTLTPPPGALGKPAVVPGKTVPRPTKTPSRRPRQKSTEGGRPDAWYYGNLPEGVPEWFVALDTDKDGQVGLYEWRAGGGKSVKEFFKHDANRDGLVTPREAVRRQ